MNWFTFTILENTVYFTFSLVYKCLKRPILCKKDRQFSKLMIQNVVKKDSPYILIYIFFHLTGKTGFKVLLILKNQSQFMRFVVLIRQICVVCMLSRHQHSRSLVLKTSKSSGLFRSYSAYKNITERSNRNLFSQSIWQEME